MNKRIWRAIIEVGFIVFLFYANLLMGEFERAGGRQGKDLAWAIGDIVTVPNFLIAVIAACIGYMVVEYLRMRL